MEGKEYETLCKDIAQNGLLESIWLHPDGGIIDGRNRYRACQEVGIAPKFRTWNGNGSLVGFVLSLNLHRRHLNSGQRAGLAVRVEPMFAEEAKERQRQSALNNQPQSLNPEKIPDSEKGDARDAAAVAVGTNGRYVSDMKRMNRDTPEIFEQVMTGEISITDAKKKIARGNQPSPADSSPLPKDKYRCIVIDPPWPMKKIERSERPNQGVELDYPVMTLDEIKQLPINDLAHADGCHLYLWVTQKYLPFGLELVQAWGFNYQCLMTWRKNVGITPYSWMYDTEHVIFAKMGSLPLKQLGLRLSFDGKVNGHSVKPEIFFNDRVLLASPEPRLEMFARKKREGFTVWGNEV
jgi:N6-adenosine-specific RNA methylase IME4